jgi:hypothetical protein
VAIQTNDPDLWELRFRNTDQEKGEILPKTANIKHSNLQHGGHKLDFCHKLDLCHKFATNKIFATHWPQMRSLF